MKNLRDITVLKVKRFSFKFINTIRFTLIISFTTPIFFIIILGIVSYRTASEGIIDKYEKATSQTINMASEYLQFGLDSVEATSVQYVSDDSIKKYLINRDDDVISNSSNLTNIKNSFAAKQLTDDFIGNIYAISKNVNPISTGANLSGTDIYTGLQESALGDSLMNNSSKSVWSGRDSYLDEKLGATEDQYAFRLIRKYINIDAVLIIDIDRVTIENIITKLQFDKTATVGIVTGDGKEILIKDKEPVDDVVFTNQEFFQKALKTNEEYGSNYIVYKDSSYLFLYSKLGDTGDTLCAMIPKSVITSQADKIRNITVVIVFVACIVAILIGLLISGSIEKVVHTIIEKLRLAANGDLTVAFETKRKDEFRILMDQLQLTFVNMKKLVIQVDELSKEVSLSAENVKGTSEAFLDTTNMITNAMDEIELGINQQAGDAEACLIEMDNLSNKITLVSDNTREISKITEVTKISIQEGTDSAYELNQQTKATMSISVETIHEIESLANRSLTIGKIVNTISEIANQTNLLSLNASIEAARAGESGKGFSVVAGEIRKLAEQSQNSVTDIKGIINKILEDTMKAVNSAKKVEEAMMLQEKAVMNSSCSFQNINDKVQDLVIRINNITENVDNIENARTSTLGAIENISAVLEEIAASTNSVNQTSNQQLKSVENSNQSAINLNKNTDKLVDALKRFKV